MSMENPGMQLLLALAAMLLLTAVLVAVAWLVSPAEPGGDGQDQE